MATIDAVKTMFFISDKSYRVLREKAHELFFVRDINSPTTRGMSHFLDELSKQAFMDTRPPLVEERHNEEISTGRAPVWTDYNVRRPRLLMITDDTKKRYYNVALQCGIIKEEPWLIGGPDRTNIHSVNSVVLEAIGIGWITPEHWPIGQQ